jgi:hypothetical protein
MAAISFKMQQYIHGIMTNDKDAPPSAYVCMYVSVCLCIYISAYLSIYLSIACLSLEDHDHLAVRGHGEEVHGRGRHGAEGLPEQTLADRAVAGTGHVHFIERGD